MKYADTGALGQIVHSSNSLESMFIFLLNIKFHVDNFIFQKYFWHFCKRWLGAFIEFIC